MNRIHSFWMGIIKLIFPVRCPICDDIVEFSGKLVCEECNGRIKYIREPVCVKCGKPLHSQDEEYCYDCTRKRHFFNKGSALFEYNSIAASVYRFKYGGRQEYAEFFGVSLARYLGSNIKRWGAEAIVPVPIHKTKMRVRGYNQAELLAKVLSRETGVPMRKDIIRRCRKTVPQKNLNDEERQNNLKKAFKICRNDVKLSTIVIVDDIYTTGSTIDAMACELQKAGVADIYYVALAIGNGL